MEPTAATPRTPPAPRLRLLLVVVSFPFSFQFFTRLAAVFAEEVGDFTVIIFCSNIQKCQFIFVREIWVGFCFKVSLYPFRIPVYTRLVN